MYINKFGNPLLIILNCDGYYLLIEAAIIEVLINTNTNPFLFLGGVPARRGSY